MEFSQDMAARTLDSPSLLCTRERQCGACHTNYPHLLARPAVANQPVISLANRFFEEQVKNWHPDGKG
jgi:hypothetical protein